MRPLWFSNVGIPTERTVERGGSDRVGIGGGFDVDQAAGSAVVGVGDAMSVLDAAVDVEHRLVAPCGVAGLGGEEVPVVLMPARPRHPIDTGSAAQHLAHRIR